MTKYFEKVKFLTDYYRAHAFTLEDGESLWERFEPDLVWYPITDRHIISFSKYVMFDEDS